MNFILLKYFCQVKYIDFFVIKGYNKPMRKIIKFLILLLCIGVLVYNGNFLYHWYRENQAATAEQDDAVAIFEKAQKSEETQLQEIEKKKATLDKEEQDDEKIITSDTASPVAKAAAKARKEKRAKAKQELAKLETEVKTKSFKQVKKKYNHIVGYLTVSGTNIKYFVTQYKDNSYYLTHSLNGQYNSAGNPFLDFRNKISDTALVIYGHNRLDKSQFGSLKWVMGKPNTKITFSNSEGSHEYKIFSTYIIKNESYFNRVYFTDYSAFLKTITNRSQYKYNVKVSSKDRILTLSTCYGASYLNRRLVVHTKMIK